MDVTEKIVYEHIQINYGDYDHAYEGGISNDDSCIGGDDFTSVTCLIFLERVAEDGVRVWASLQCDCQFHLGCSCGCVY
ncbi:unnamed protein product [Eruca vesicaria subsp. sativa]|uniref:Uncharacterized protein n=1 Tax=Eruca vesicaria subsp. sativa TaxID=29727 RepID=A0ABC8M9P1_ERUVS|nr:unnamed protein product [Eruca vesicaria subsp. sativa]